MKKFKVLMLMMSILCLGLVACGGDDDVRNTTHTVRVEITFDDDREGLRHFIISWVHQNGNVGVVDKIGDQITTNPVVWEMDNAPWDTMISVGTAVNGVYCSSTNIRAFVDGKQVQLDNRQGVMFFTVQ